MTTKMIQDATRMISAKVALAIGILFLILSSDIFVQGVLGKISGATDGGKRTTNSGALLQAFMLALCYLLLSAASGLALF